MEDDTGEVVGGVGVGGGSSCCDCRQLYWYMFELVCLELAAAVQRP